MTGDDAVVREWHEGAGDLPVDENHFVIDDAVAEHNAAIRQQAAEIERLTRERDEFETMYHECADKRREGLRITADLNKEMWAARDKVVASEARAAALEPYEKLALQLTDACVRWGWGHCTAGPELIGQIDSEIARTADLLKALERYGHHMVDCESQRAASRTSASCGPCTCGLAAAKGETV